MCLIRRQFYKAFICHTAFKTGTFYNLKEFIKLFSLMQPINNFDIILFWLKPVLHFLVYF